MSMQLLEKGRSGLMSSSKCCCELVIGNIIRVDLIIRRVESGSDRITLRFG